MAEKLLLPILNKTVNTFKGPTLFLENEVTIETISPQEYSAVFSKIGPERAWFVTPKSKCIKVCSLDCGSDIEEARAIARREAAKAAFTLNFFMDKHPAALCIALKITEKRKARLEDILDLSFVGDTYSHHRKPFRIRRGVQREDIRNLYHIITEAEAKYPNLLLTLGRFNSALLRQETHDKIVDISICLESLLQGTTELRHRFALYNAWVSEETPAGREKAFKLLLALYDARSAIVHGESTTKGAGRRNVDAVLNRWDEVVRITTRAVGYQILFLYSSSFDDWGKHQQKLALGLESRKF